MDALQVREYGRSMLVARVALYQGLIVGVSTAVALAVGASRLRRARLEPGHDDRLLCGADDRAQPRDALDRADVCLFKPIGGVGTPQRGYGRARL